MRANFRTGRRVMAGLVATVAVGTACTGSDKPVAFTPTFAPVECPADVQGIVVLQMKCGYLTVLQDRSKPGGRTIELFVTRIQPPDGAVKPDPMFTIGDLGVVPDYAGITPQAQRIGREIIIMDPRGVGHSRPSLVCSEVGQLSTSPLGAPTDDAEVRSQFLNAVAACRGRLTKRGVDPSSYDLHENATDIEDLRKTLRIDQWGLSAHGTESRVILQVLREYPQHVREVVLDSADFPQVDPFTEEIESTRYAIGQMDSACSADPSCSRRFPDLEQAVAQIVSRLTQKPASVTVPSAAGQPGTTILFDGAMFLRGLRDLLAAIPRDGVGPQIPATIYQVLDATSNSSLEAMASRMAADQTYCDGYQPKCDSLHPLTEGAFYSILCRDIEPFVDRDALARLAGSDPVYVEAFVRDPYLDVCTPWKVPPADPSVASPVHTDVPTLIFAGQFDPFGSLPIAQEGARTFSRAWVENVPGQGHNVLGVDECSRSIRNAWVDNPTSPPANTDCLSTLRLAFTSRPL